MRIRTAMRPLVSVFLFSGLLFPVLVVGLGAGCGAHNKKKVEAPPPPPPPPPPKGEVMRLKEAAGAAGQGKVSIRVENEPLVVKPSHRGGKLVRAYTLSEEHKIESVAQDGTQHITGRLLDVEAKTDSPKEQREAEAQARALNEIKIAFDRSARGKVENLEISDVNRPLDPVTARIVAGSIYGAGRGDIFAEDRVEVGKGWTVKSEVPIPNGGSNNLEVNYQYQKREGDIVTCSFTGKSSGESQGAQLTGEVQGEFRFDLAKGAFLSMQVDTKSARDPGPGAPVPGSVLRVHVEWEATQPAAPAQDGATPAATGK